MYRRKFLKTLGGAIPAVAVPFAHGLIPQEVRTKVPAGLKITGLKVFPCENYGQGVLYVKVLTNEGITGLGEGSLWPDTSVAALKEFEQYIIGEDPTDIEYLWKLMYQAPFWRGGVILMSAISAIDIACWDILGKIAGLPIYKLLGGRARDKIRLYSHGGGSTPAQAAESIHSFIELGYNAIKTGCNAYTGNVIQQPWNLKHSIDILKAMRDAAGDNFDICIDAHGDLTPVMAMEYANAIEPYRPMFLEEPIQPGNLDMFEWLNQRTKVPLATGERLFSREEFKPLIDKELVSYVQPDILHVGGITECRKIAIMADANMIHMAPHNPNGLVSTMASLHINACSHCSVILETVREMRDPQQWQLDLHFGERLAFKDGFASLPDKPGLGIDLDEKVVLKHPRKLATGHRGPYKFQDGSVADH